MNRLATIFLLLAICGCGSTESLQEATAPAQPSSVQAPEFTDTLYVPELPKVEIRGIETSPRQRTIHPPSDAPSINVHRVSVSRQEDEACPSGIRIEVVYTVADASYTDTYCGPVYGETTHLAPTDTTTQDDTTTTGPTTLDARVEGAPARETIDVLLPDEDEWTAQEALAWIGGIVIALLLALGIGRIR